MKRKPFLLSIEPWGEPETGALVTIMLWSVGEGEPTLAEAHTLATHSAVRACLSSIVAKCGVGSIALEWSDALRADHALAAFVAIALNVQIPKA